jgi:hypothetical protein
MGPETSSPRILGDNYTAFWTIWFHMSARYCHVDGSITESSKCHFAVEEYGKISKFHEPGLFAIFL